MIKHLALLFAVAIALLGGPALAQDAHGNDSAASAPVGPAMMNDIRFTMRTMMSDPVIVKRMNQLTGTNPQFKKHFEQMRGMMASQGWMMNGQGGMMGGGSGNYGPMMSSTAPVGPAMMNDIRFTMRTMMNDPVTVKRMKQLTGTNSQFKKHFEQMRGMMASQGWMMNGQGGMMGGGSGNYGPMMSATPPPKP